MSVTFTKADLGQFTGTQNYFSHPFFPNCVYSDGAQHLMKNGAAWLVEAIMSHLQANRAFRTAMAKNERLRGMQFWDIKLNGKGGATLTCVEDSGFKPAVTQEIEYTDLPFDLRLYAEETQWQGPRGVVTGWLVYLPSER